MSTANLREIGSISLLELNIISRFYGRDFLPFPFMRTKASGFLSHDEYIEYARSVPDRFTNGDLRTFQQWAGLYANADIRVECHVQYIPADTASVRVVAARRDQAGLLAKQRPDEDIIDIYELSPYQLGSAVAEAAALIKPGRRAGIIIPEYAPAPNNAAAGDEVTVRHIFDATPSAIEVPRAQVTAFGTVQTHWRPTRHWGIDPGKNLAVWVRIKDDGDYLYKPDFSEATPVTRPLLAERIDRLISEDVKALRQFRN
jgi:hypothetical protein